VRNALVYALPQSINKLNNKKMPKVKTNSGAKKRFRFTGTGKIKRHHAYHSHILTKKTKKQKRNLVHQAIVDNSNLKQVRDLLCLR
jgi:large subunit ribosomal protein L35